MNLDGIPKCAKIFHMYSWEIDGKAAWKSNNKSAPVGCSWAPMRGAVPISNILAVINRSMINPLCDG